MLNLAISIDTDARGIDIVETNDGEHFKSPDWPRDCEFQMVAFRPSSKTCEVVWAPSVAEDIGHALRALEAAGTFKNGKPDWYKRLALCAAGADSMSPAR